jgi:hypothetical protein
MTTPTTVPATTSPPEPEPPQPLDVAALVVPTLNDLRTTHPELPPLDAVRFDPDGAWGQPYLPLAPVTALAAWAAVLPGCGPTEGRAADWHAGTQLSVTGRIGPYAVTLAVITYVAIEPGHVSNGVLARLAADESIAAAPAERAAHAAP